MAQMFADERQEEFVDRINMIDRIKDIVDSSAILVANIC